MTASSSRVDRPLRTISSLARSRSLPRRVTLTRSKGVRAQPVLRRRMKWSMIRACSVMFTPWAARQCIHSRPGINLFNAQCGMRPSPPQAGRQSAAGNPPCPPSQEQNVRDGNPAGFATGARPPHFSVRRWSANRRVITSVASLRIWPNLAVRNHYLLCAKYSRTRASMSSARRR